MTDSVTSQTLALLGADSAAKSTGNNAAKSGKYDAKSSDQDAFSRVLDEQRSAPDERRSDATSTPEARSADGKNLPSERSQAATERSQTSAESRADDQPTESDDGAFKASLDAADQAGDSVSTVSASAAADSGREQPLPGVPVQKAAVFNWAAGAGSETEAELAETAVPPDADLAAASAAIPAATSEATSASASAAVRAGNAEAVPVESLAQSLPVTSGNAGDALSEAAVSRQSPPLLRASDSAIPAPTGLITPADGATPAPDLELAGFDSRGTGSNVADAAAAVAAGLRSAGSEDAGLEKRVPRGPGASNETIDMSVARSRADWLRESAGGGSALQQAATEVQPESVLDAARLAASARAESAPPSNLTPLASSLGAMPAALASGTASSAASQAPPGTLLSDYALSHAPDDPEFPAELTARMKTLLRDGVREARLQLHPAELGRLQVTVSTDGDQARISFVADSAAARDAIEQSMPRLRDMLAQNGMQLAQSDVAQRGFQGGGNDSSDGSPADRPSGEFGTSAEIDGQEQWPVTAVTSRIDTYI